MLLHVGTTVKTYSITLSDVNEVAESYPRQRVHLPPIQPCSLTSERLIFIASDKEELQTIQIDNVVARFMGTASITLIGLLGLMK